MIRRKMRKDYPERPTDKSKNVTVHHCRAGTKMKTTLAEIKGISNKLRVELRRR
jgi:hypothetical protein